MSTRYEMRRDRNRHGWTVVDRFTGWAAKVPRYPQVDSALIKAIARAFRWQKLLETGSYATIAEIAAGAIRRSADGYTVADGVIFPILSAMSIVTAAYLALVEITRGLFYRSFAGRLRFSH
jgi:hypothetical protein